MYPVLARSKEESPDSPADNVLGRTTEKVAPRDPYIPSSSDVHLCLPGPPLCYRGRPNGDTDARQIAYNYQCLLGSVDADPVLQKECSGSMAFVLITIHAIAISEKLS